MSFNTLVLLLLLVIVTFQVMILKRLGSFKFPLTSTPGFSDDEMLAQAREIIKPYDKVSASLLQRKLAIGYSRAARLLDQLSDEGLVSEAVGAQPRTVLSHQSN